MNANPVQPIRPPAACPHVLDSEVVVVGSGLAGLACALALAPRRVTLVTKTAQLEGGSSLWAQGGIAAALGADDSPDDHAEDTLAAGAGLSDPEMAALLVEQGAREVRALMDDGLPFDRTANGTPAFGREAAHRRARVVHAGGDATGRTVVRTLASRVRAAASIRVADKAFAYDLCVHGDRIVGVLVYLQTDGWVWIRSPHVVLATGGIGAVWRDTTTPSESTGDGLAMAARAGAALADLEFMQFHPTALAARDQRHPGRLPLLTEALRGAGAVLLDGRGRRFMIGEHPNAELAPRDVVARAIWRRVAAGESVSLDLRPALAARGEDVFPQVLEICRNAGFDAARAPVPITPAAHYHMGGVATDLWGRTSINGLWACGEVASTGVHGANRLASNSLLEALVFGRRVADDIRRRAIASADADFVPGVPRLPVEEAESVLSVIQTRLHAIMHQHVSIARVGADLNTARTELYALETRLAERTGSRPPTSRPPFTELVRWGETRNTLLVAQLVTLAALRRTESRGAHFRSDFPHPRTRWRRHQALSIEDLRADRGAAADSPALSA